MYFTLIKLIELKRRKTKLSLSKIACIWGCSSTCTIESNYVWSGGTTSNLMSLGWIFLSGT